MIDHNLLIRLPLPWVGQTFQTNHIGAINFLVGPNGSGKSRFAAQLARQLDNARLLGTDRLSEMAWPGSLRNYLGDHFQTGFAKNSFDAFRAAGREGSGIDTIVLLEERMDLRIQIEATLSHLFDRDITLEWDSGNLIPKMGRRGHHESYRLDREECHGIKELLVLLTHLYDDKQQYLIIDEPELNLHPQYQAFFMQEVRKFAGDPNINAKRKVIFLITHSPFILDLQSSDDIKSIISFDLEYSEPKQVADLDLDISLASSITRRLNSHHKQLFFSDNPIFVEGIHDAWLVEAMMEARGVSVARAGSCVIDVGGYEQVNQYLNLCQGLGKSAYFLYDLDSLFSGNLRACIKDDESVQGFLLSSGLGNDIGKYCGQMEQELTHIIKRFISVPLPLRLSRLGIFLKKLGESSQWKPKDWAMARMAVMIAISRYREEVVSVLTHQTVEDIEGRRDQILSALSEKNIYVLPGGTLERYLPHYNGDEYQLNDESKKKAVHAEIEEMVNLSTEEELSDRYGELYDVVRNLPAKAEVDPETVLRKYLSDYIHELQKAVVSNPDWEQDQIQAQVNGIKPSLAKVFSINAFTRSQHSKFSATIEIAELLGQGTRSAHVDEQTTAGMLNFEIESSQPPTENVP